jgi:hypothetical protein
MLRLLEASSLFTLRKFVEWIEKMNACDILIAMK